ncbi:hypothetical protein ACQKDS_20005 [Serratia sp. NPDC078593]|uniref:hypothetical protein n=1 Tax=unclassified Serratia (in: enterobacteria) TaxID=2647522 RepID=UPI0037D6FED8
MKIFFAFLFSTFFSVSTFGCKQSETELMSCSFQGEGNRNVSFRMNNETQKISYSFSKNGEDELRVLFDEKNMLKRAIDKENNITYYGFNRGKYSYIINIINGKGFNEYSISFSIKYSNKVIQSNDCLGNSYKASNINSKYIKDVPFNFVGGEFQFP